jgi:hypothetical protein
MLGNPQLLRTPSILMDYISFQKLYTGLSKAPWALYARPKTFLLYHEYVTGSVEQTHFTLKHANDFLLVQIYVDDIIFNGSSHVLVSKFQGMMENEFQISIMRELTFFLDIQVKQMK